MPVWLAGIMFRHVVEILSALSAHWPDGSRSTLPQLKINH